MKKKITRSELSDLEILASLKNKNLLLSRAKAMIKKYNEKVKILFKIDDSTIAFTDGDNIVLNPSPEQEMLALGPTLKEKKALLEGLLVHEVGHLLYTDFKSDYNKFNTIATENSIETLVSSMELSEREEEGYKLVEELLLQKKNQTFFKAIKDFTNIIEDAYLEYQILEEYPGQPSKVLEYLRDWQKFAAPTLEYQLEKEIPFSKIKEALTEGKEIPEGLIKSLIMTNLVLFYAKYGICKTGEKGERSDYYYELCEVSDLIDEAICQHESSNRFKYSLKILLHLWKEFFHEQALEDPETEMEKEDTTKMKGRPKGAKRGARKKRSSGGSSSGSSSGSGGSGEAKGEENSEDEENEGEGSTDTKGSSSEPDNDSKSGVSGVGAGENSEGAGGPDTEGSDERELSSTYEGENSGDGDGYAIKAESELDEPTLPSFLSSEEEVESLVSSVIEERTLSDYEKELKDESEKIFKDCISSVSGKLHNDRTYYIIRPSKDMEEYNKIKTELNPYIQKMKNKLQNVWKKASNTGELKGQYMGKKINPSSFAKNDFRYFSKKTLPKGRSLAIAVLVDESGSMYGQRAEAARKAAITIYEFCKAMDIPVMVTGHTADEHHSGSVEILSYVEFDSIDANDKYRLAKIKSRSNNADGAANHYVCAKLAERPEEQKLFIVISDGQPAASGYYGSKGIEDIKAVKKTYRNIKTFAAAIGSDKDAIKDCYGADCFLDITDLDLLPDRLISLIRRFMRVN